MTDYFNKNDRKWTCITFLSYLKTLLRKTEPLIDYQRYKINIFYKDDRMKMIQDQYYTQLNETKKYTSFETNFIQLATGNILKRRRWILKPRTAGRDVSKRESRRRRGHLRTSNFKIYWDVDVLRRLETMSSYYLQSLQRLSTRGNNARISLESPYLVFLFEITAR